MKQMNRLNKGVWHSSQMNFTCQLFRWRELTKWGQRARPPNMHNHCQATVFQGKRKDPLQSQGMPAAQCVCKSRLFHKSLTDEEGAENSAKTIVTGWSPAYISYDRIHYKNAGNHGGGNPHGRGPGRQCDQVQRLNQDPSLQNSHQGNSISHEWAHGASTSATSTISLTSTSVTDIKSSSQTQCQLMILLTSLLPFQHATVPKAPLFPPASHNGSSSVHIITLPNKTQMPRSE